MLSCFYILTNCYKSPVNHPICMPGKELRYPYSLRYFFPILLGVYHPLSRSSMPVVICLLQIALIISPDSQDILNVQTCCHLHIPSVYMPKSCCTSLYYLEIFHQLVQFFLSLPLSGSSQKSCQ